MPIFPAGIVTGSLPLVTVALLGAPSASRSLKTVPFVRALLSVALMPVLPWMSRLTVAALAVAATGLVAVALAFGAACTRPETAGAVVSGLVVAGLVLAVVRLPELRRLPRDSGQTAVEKMVRLER